MDLCNLYLIKMYFLRINVDLSFVNLTNLTSTNMDLTDTFRGLQQRNEN